MGPLDSYGLRCGAPAAPLSCGAWWHMVVICVWCSLFVTSQFDVIFMFPNQRFGEVCRQNMHILLHALILIYVSWCQGVLLKKEVWERRSHTKYQGRLIRLQEFPHWIFLFHFMVLRCYTRESVSFIHLCCSRHYT